MRGELLHWQTRKVNRVRPIAQGDSHRRTRAYASPVTLGILIGYVVGKPVGTTIRTISKHGKVMTLSTKLKDVNGKRNEMIAVYDKQ